MKSKFRIFWHERLDSTNSEALRRIQTLDNLSVIAAVEQTAGRGQRGNRWSSEAGKNLTFSVVLRFGEKGLPPLPAARQFNLSCVATLAVQDFLRAAGVRVRIKWPNDLYAGDRKICGMLIENGLEGAGLAWSIVGIGLNLNQTDFPAELVNPTSLARLTGRSFPLGASLESLLGHFDCWLEKLNDTEALHAAYLKDLYRIGECREYVDCRSGESFLGTICGITPEGRLRVTLPDGGLRIFAFKEISYVI